MTAAAPFLIVLLVLLAGGPGLAPSEDTAGEG